MKWGPKSRKNSEIRKCLFRVRFLKIKEIKEQTNTFRSVYTLISVKWKVLPLLFSHIERKKEDSCEIKMHFFFF